MRVLTLATSAALLLSVVSAIAQTESEDEQLVFVDVVGRSVQLPLSFAAAICGMTVNKVTSNFVGITDPACELDEAGATQMGLVDETGETVDLSRQGFVNVQLPYSESRVQMSRSLAARSARWRRASWAMTQARSG